MERLESEQPILGTSELFSNDRENHSGLALPIPNVSPNPIQASQSSLPELGADLIPTDVANILPNNTVFKSDNGLFRWSEPHIAKPGFDSLTGLSWKTTSYSSEGGIAQKVISKVRITSILSAEASVKETLQGFFRRSDWQQTFQEVFGTEFNKDRAQGLAAAFAKGDFSALPPIEILPASVLNGARGGFDTKTGKIYLSDTLLRIRKGNSSLLKSSLLEEIGHFIDAQVNRNDTPGDEGELFASRLQAIALSGADLLRIKSEDDHATIWLNGSQHVIEQASTFPNFAIRTEGSLRMNGGGDLDGDPLNLQDDALVYAARGFTINGNATLPVQRDANGNIIRDASGKAILVPNALTVATGYTSNTGPTNSYAGINPPTVISPQTIDIPSYTSLLNQTLSSRVPSGTAEVIFNAQTPLNTIADWNSKFPSGGTATNPRVVHVINGGLNIPSNAVLSNTVIKVDSGDINFNGNGQNFTNVVLIATNGNVNLNNVNATDLSVFSSGAINVNGSAKIGGTSLFATRARNGNVTFNGSTKTVTGTDQLQVIAQGNITYNGSSDTRGSFLSAGTFTFNGSSTLYGSIGAKGNITFNGKTTVIGASIRPLNQAPTDLGLSPASLAENVLGNSVVGTLSTTDPNPGNTFTYSLVSGTGATDNAAFTISGNQLKINASPDFEAKSNYSVRVRTTDQDGLSYEKTLTVSIADVNETPTSLVLSNSITPENVAAGSVIGNFSTTDPDANNTFTYSLVAGTGDVDNAAFSLIGNQLKINASPNFEAKSNYSVRVRTTDQGGLSYDKALVINVSDVNEVPTSLVLSNNVTPENVVAGSVIGTFTSTDPDANNTFTYSLVTGTGATDNTSFSIVGNQLKVNTSPDFEAKSSYSILVRTTDQGGLSVDQAMTIAITNQNEAPTAINLSTASIGENTPIGTAIGTLSATDPDANDTQQYSLVSGTGDGDNSAFAIIGNQLQLQSAANFALHPNYSVRVRATDAGGLSFEKVLTIAVTDTIAPLINGGLANDTGNNTDNLTSDPSIQGQVSDNGMIAQLRAWFQGQPHNSAQSIQFALNNNGQYQLTRSQLEVLYGYPLSDGAYTLNIEAIDSAGNLSTVGIHFNLDTTAPANLSVNLSADSDTGPVGDLKTQKGSVTLTGQAEPYAQIKLVNTGTILSADANGQFQFTNIALTLGNNVFTLEATDAAGNQRSISQTVTRLSGTDVVLDWNAIALEAIRTDRTAPPQAAYILALMQTAVFDSLDAITPLYESYQIDVQAPADASPEAAAVAAAHRILVHYFPHQQMVLDRAYLASLAKIADGVPENEGIALGESVADQLLELRANDGYNTVVAYTPGTDIGEWRPTPANYYGAALPQWPDVQTFALVDGAQFRPSGPPALDSATYAADYSQVQSLGAKNSTTRTADQTQIAKFWADGAGTYTPPGHWNQIAQEAAANSGNSLLENARLFALLNVSLADSGIAAWDAKYQYDLWRPITAIQQGNLDGNSLTIGDPTWTPLIATPPFPEYVSGHSTFSGAAATILSGAFGNTYSFSTTTFGLPGVTRTFTSFDQAADEAGISRIYGGIHFNFANQDGLTLGRNIGSYVADNYFKPVNRSTVIQVGLANDTAPVGTTNRDKVTSDPTLTGTITSPNAVLKASLDGTSSNSYQDLTALVGADGRFTLNQATLSQLNGGALSDGVHTVYLQVLNAQGTLLDTQAVAFVLDRGTPSVSFAAPTANAIYSPTAHLKGKIEDALSQAGTVRYSVDGQAFQQFKADAVGQFDQIISPVGLGVGTHQVAVEIYDAAGNMSQTSIAFTVSDQFSAGGAQSDGWGAQTADTLSLYEGHSLVVQKTTPVTLGVNSGTRTLEFDLDPTWDLKDTNAIAQDRLLVYLVDPSNPSRTLVDGGEAGTALLSVSGNQAEYRPGLVRFDGRHVSIDVSSLPEGTTGNLVFQMLNLDGDTGSSVQIRNLSNTVDVTGTPSPIFPATNPHTNAGPAVALDSYLSNPNAKVLLSNVHLDSTTGRVLADLRIQNTGTTAMSSNMAVLFTNLPNGVSLANASGTHAAGSPYLNLKPALTNGDLNPGATSGAIQVVLGDPNLTQFDLQTVVLTGGLDQPPQLQSLGTLNVTVGGRLEVPLMAIDPQGDRVVLSLRDANNLPTGSLENGKLLFNPAPGDVGTYQFTLVATSNGLETTQAVTLNVAADPVTTTRVSGVVQDTNQAPLAGILVDVDGWQAVTDAQGRFTVELPGTPPTNTLRIMGGLTTGSNYPSIAEKLPLVLEHDVYAGVNNEIARPIYLPVIDIASGQLVDSAHDAVVTSVNLPGASVSFGAGALKDLSGNSFTGVMSITEVPVNLTPAALPGNLHPDLVVTIQPGEMQFTTPAQLSLPNRAGYAPGTLMDLWSINPTTGLFDNVGTGQVSADGTVINTISGGVRNSSWHFFAPPPPVPGSLGDNPRNPKQGCDTGKPDSLPLNSSADLQSGAVEETHNLVSYQSLGITRGLSLHYDSLRADPRPIVHFGFSGINSANTSSDDKLVAKLSVQRGNFTYSVPGVQGGQYGLTGGENIWSIPPNTSGAIDAALQVDLSSLASGQYSYTVESGIRRFSQNQFFGSSASSSNTFISVNSVNSAFGSGWGLSGLQHLVENDDKSILLIDGNGSEYIFQSPAKAGDPYISPPGHFSTLVRLSDGTFQLKEKDQTVSTFNGQNQLAQVEDSNHNVTRYVYDVAGNLSQVVDPVGLTTTFNYTGNRVASIVDPAGRVTQMQYDASGNLLSITEPDGSQNAWEYDDKHHMIANTDSRGNRGTDSYDFAGRVMGAVRKDGSIVQIQPIEVQGLYRPEQTTNPLAAPPVFQLGAPLSSQVDGNGNTSSLLIDQAGQLVSSTDGIGKQSSVSRNGQNLISKETDALGNITQFAYDDRGNLTSLQDSFAYFRQPALAPAAPPDDTALFRNPLYKVGSYAHIVSADLDGDNNLDLISTDSYNGSVSILFGNNEGNYSGPVNYTVDAASQIFVTDINQDQFLDLITTNGSGQAINVLINNGQGNFTRTSLPNLFDPSNNINSVKLVDLNGDGAIDLAFTATVYSGGGYGEADFGLFAAANSFSTFAAPTSNSDNGTQYKILTLLNQGNGTFSTPSEYLVAEGISSLLSSDVNGDNREDLIVWGSGYTQLSVLISQGNGSFAPQTAYDFSSPIDQVLSADLNQDGFKDLVVESGSANQVSVLLNNRDGSFAAPTNYSVSGSITFADISGDGSLDMLLANDQSSSVYMMRNQGNGTFGAVTEYKVEGSSSSILVGDVDADHQLDLIVTSYIYSPNTFTSKTRVTTLLNDGENGFITPIQYDTANVSPILIQDFNHDNRLDLVGLDWTNETAVLMQGNGDGSFRFRLGSNLPNPRFSTGPVAPTRALAVGLLDNDDIPDVVYTNYYGYQNDFTIYPHNYISLNLSSSSVDNPLPDSYGTGQGPTAIAIGDVDGDGHNDLAIANGLGNTVSIRLNNGDGSFSNTPMTYGVGSMPQDLAFGDFNQDGRLDLVVSNANGNDVSILFNQGNGSFANAVSVSAGHNPYALAVGDMNGDGRADIAVANYSGGITLLLNQADGTFASSSSVYDGAGYSTRINYAVGGTAIALGDINRDGYLDVVITDSSNNQTSVWLNQLDGTVGARTNYKVGSNPQALSLGDMNRDGYLDIVTANSSGSATVLLGNSQGTFAARQRQDFEVGGYAGSLALADLDRDGDLDFVTQVFQKGDNYYIYNSQSPTNFFTSRKGSSEVYVGYNNLVKTSNDSGSVNPAPVDTTVGLIRRYTYDPIFNQLQSETDELGRQTIYSRDPLTGNVTSVRQVVGLVGGSDDVITRYTYTTRGQVDLMTDALGHIDDYDYDAQGRVIQVTTAKGTNDEAIRRFEYDAAGNRTAIIDENGHRTEFVYDALNRLVQVTEADPDGIGALASPITRYEYDASGNQTAVTNSRGFTTRFAYDSLNRAIQATDALNGVVQNEYDRAGNLIAMTDELGHRMQYRYDSRNRLVESIDSEGGRTQYLYDANNNQIAQIDALGRRTDFAYDARNRLISKTDPLGGSTNYVYDAVGNLIAQTDANGHQTKFTYDDLNRLIKTTDALGNVETFRYDKDSNVIAQTDALGRTTTFTYDNRNRLIAKVDALNGRISMTYDGVGNLLTLTDELNRTTTYGYDALNRQISVSDALGQTTSFSYDSEGNRVAVTDALDRTTSYTYDALDRQVLMTNAIGGTNTTAYDAAGNLIAQTDELNRTTSYTYDSRNWLTAITDPLNHTSTRTYDAVGNILTTADGLGHTTNYGYDSLDRTISTTDAVGQTTFMTYDRVGNLLSLTDPDRNQTSYTYDALDRQLTDTNQLGLSRTYSYDAVGNETSLVDRNGRKTSYLYDALDRQTQEIWLDASNAPIRTTTRSYDAASQLTAISDPDSRYTYTYDSAGRLITVDNTGTAYTATVLLSYGYDAVNNLTSVTDTINGQQAGTTAYTYDALNRTTQITQSGTGVSNKRVDLTYDAASQRTGIARYADLLGIQNVATTDYSYDLAGKLTRLTHQRNSTTYADYQWTFDAADRIVQFISPDGTSNYNYDSRDQLTSTDYSYQTDENYTYDANGNRTNAGYQTGQNNRLLTDGNYSYTYDNEGNRTSRTNIATGELTQYNWDYHNRLTSVITKDNSGTVTKSVEYTYDAYGRRIAKEIDPDGLGAAPVQTERMVYDGDNIALTLDGTGTQTHRYLHGPRVDEILADETSTGVNWALTDNQGTVRDVIDSNGVVLNHLVYDSFGQVTSETNPTVDFRYGYTGRERDEETGLDYYRTRYYDSLVGRFVSEDTIGFNGGDANLYRYVANSPLNFNDPNGTDLYDFVNGVDQAVGGFASGATGGATDIIREKIYGRSVNDNQQGLLHDGASVLGDAASSVVGGGAAKGGSRLVRAGAGLLNNASKAADKYNKAKSAYDIASGCGDAEDWKNLASGWGGNKRGGNDGKPPVSGIQQNNLPNNKAQGAAFEPIAKKRFEKDAHSVQEQVTIKTSNGTKIRADLIGKDKKTGDIIVGEAKSSQTAPLTKNQKKGFPDLSQNGGVVVGKGKPGFPGGTQIPPTQVQIIRPKI